MNLDLPGVVARYFEADRRRDPDAVIAQFTDDAAVTDEGQTRRGAAEILAWLRGPASQYQYTITLLGAETTGADTVLVTGRLEGNFPGGTADLKWRFTLAGDRIRQLEIAP
ncbi:nuclear transport factor 2 family protein [Nonomuraea rubra]|uniref:Ketosteroid isomerase-like protein n=1 Tax=Nonomuraea rubra TaxID=46180 RepID=A0A7X0P5W8_9ACTN|nr:nuclear transport factor 2 family protein [Nonomuraea rubra]MBB6555835.1 ketosteroid isomerase-like protein [Nonomuraea rubra]